MAEQHPRAKAWYRLASETFGAADALRKDGHVRSAASRFYYASFQAAHAILLCTPAQSDLPTRGNWDHKSALNGVVAMLRRYASVSQVSAQALRIRLGEAYGTRIQSDYGPESSVGRGQMDDSRNAAAALVRHAQRMVAS